MKRKTIENRLKEKIAKAVFFVLTAVFTSVSYLIELRPLIVLTLGYYGCGMIDGIMITLALVAFILYFEHRF